MEDLDEISSVKIRVPYLYTYRAGNLIYTAAKSFLRTCVPCLCVLQSSHSDAEQAVSSNTLLTDILFYVYACYIKHMSTLCILVSHVSGWHLRKPQEVLDLSNWSYGWLWNAVWMLRTEFGSSGRADSTPNHWHILVAPVTLLIAKGILARTDWRSPCWLYKLWDRKT